MSITKLPTNYVDDVLDISVNEHRKYKITETEESDVYTFEDKTEYIQTGTDFDASKVNLINETVNDVIDLAEGDSETLADIMDGNTAVPKANHANTATSATTANTATTATTAGTAETATTANSVANDFILANKQTLVFQNNICTISDARITVNSVADVFFTSATIAEARRVGISVNTLDGNLTLSAGITPESSLVATIRVRVI